MSEKEKLLLEADKRVGKDPKGGLGATVTKVVEALAVATGLTLAQDAVAQDAHVYYPMPTSGVTIPYQAPAENTEDTISWDEAVKLSGIQPDTIGGEVTEEGIDSQVQQVQDSADTVDVVDMPDTDQKKESKISIGGMFEVGSGVAADAAEVCSTRPELLSVLNVNHKKTGLGISLVRLDDFSKDMSNPCSQATIVNPYWTTKLGPDGKFRITAEGKYTFFDKIPELNGFAPDIKLEYSDKGWTIEGMYIHKFQKGGDSDAIRLSVSKSFDDILKLTLQAWYETGYDKHFYGRVIATVDLGHGFLGELSFIAKNGKITPTGGIIYVFQK